jgi:hypothetical protein
LTAFLPLITGRMYVDIRNRTENLAGIRADTLDQSVRITSAFMQMVDEQAWLDANGKKNAHEKGTITFVSKHFQC